MKVIVYIFYLYKCTCFLKLFLSILRVLTCRKNNILHQLGRKTYDQHQPSEILPGFSCNTDTRCVQNEDIKVIIFAQDSGTPIRKYDMVTNMVSHELTTGMHNTGYKSCNCRLQENTTWNYFKTLWNTYSID